MPGLVHLQGLIGIQDASCLKLLLIASGFEDCHAVLVQKETGRAYERVA